MVEIKEFLKTILLHEHFHRYAAYLLLLLALWTMRSIFWTQRAAIKEAIKGDNHHYDMVEIAFLMWLVLYSTVIFGTLFFGLNCPEERWWTLEIIIFFVLGGKKAPEIIMAIKGKGMQEVQVTETKVEGDTVTETKVKKQEQVDPETSPTPTSPPSSTTEKKGGGSESLDSIGL
jgi:Sec-independent protein translocase protein TatA